MLRTIKGTYGSSKTPTDIIIYEDFEGVQWYTAKGSSTVNATNEMLYQGTDMEKITDIDVFTWSKEINSEEDLEIAVKD